MCYLFFLVFCFKQKTAYEMRISDWSSDVCSSDLPAAGQHLEAFRRAGPLDDFNRPFADLAQRLPELVASIAAIGEDMPQPREAMDDFRQYEWCAVAVLAVGRVDYGMTEMADVICEVVALASLGLCRKSVGYGTRVSVLVSVGVRR